LEIRKSSIIPCVSSLQIEQYGIIEICKPWHPPVVKIDYPFFPPFSQAYRNTWFYGISRVLGSPTKDTVLGKTSGNID